MILGGGGGSRGTLSLVYILTWCQKKSSNMDKLQPPSALVLTGNLAENWRCFLAVISDLQSGVRPSKKRWKSSSDDTVTHDGTRGLGNLQYTSVGR